MSNQWILQRKEWVCICERYEYAQACLRTLSRACHGKQGGEHPASLLTKQRHVHGLPLPTVLPYSYTGKPSALASWRLFSSSRLCFKSWIWRAFLRSSLLSKMNLAGFIAVVFAFKVGFWRAFTVHLSSLLWFWRAFGLKSSLQWKLTGDSYF